MKGLFRQRRGRTSACIMDRVEKDKYFSEDDVIIGRLNDEKDSPSLAMTEECQSFSSTTCEKIPTHIPVYPDMFCCSVAPLLPAPTDTIVGSNSDWEIVAPSGDRYMHQEECKVMSISTDDLSLMPCAGRPPKPEISPSRTLREMAESLSDFLCAFDNAYYNLNHEKSCCIYCGQCDCCRCTNTNLSFDGILSVRAIQNEIYKLRKTLEYEIRHMLGSASEQAGKCLDIIRDWLCNFCTISSQGQPEKLEMILLHNRRHVVHSYQKRVQKLRAEMHFNPSIKYHNHSLLNDTRSMEGPASRCSITDFSNNSSTTPEQSLVCATDCMDGPDGSILLQHDQSLCYDSDPGDYRQLHIAPRRASSLNYKNYRYPSTTVPQHLVRERYCFNQEEPSMFCTSGSSDEDDYPNAVSHFSFDLSNDDMVSHFIQELINDNITLVYHPLQTEINVSTSPVCVSAWFEMGSRLKDKVIQPKFMWRPAYLPDDMSKKSVLYCKPPDAIELLNIVRVLKPEYLDRDQHPFAKLQNSFSLQSNTNQIYLFEAYSEKDRDRFVHGLKLLVARLASKIIVGDEDVFEEFFTPTGLLGTRWGKNIDSSPKNGKHLQEEPTNSSLSSEDGSQMNEPCIGEKPEIFKFNEVLFNR